MKNFEHYLKEEGMKPSTIAQHCSHVIGFKVWMKEESLAITEVSYSELLDYADQLQKEGSSTGHVNRVLLSVRYYFSWLQKEIRGMHNPAVGIRLKGAVRGIPHGLLEKAELEALYAGYVVKDLRTQRNKVILSLLVYQGLTVEDLQQLEADHIKLKEGKICVPAGSSSNSRVLKLEAAQIMELHEYIHITRPAILTERNRGKSGRKPDQLKPSDQIGQLFISVNGCEQIKNSLLHLGYVLKNINPKYKNAGHIRQSVITEWLKEKDLRRVQYMAGHRYVSSTERYQTSNLEDLKDALKKHHPLK
jgi:integrase/recombinase XerD